MIITLERTVLLALAVRIVDKIALIVLNSRFVSIHRRCGVL